MGGFGLCVEEGIWSGKVIYHAVSQHAMIADVSRLSLSVSVQISG